MDGQIQTVYLEKLVERGQELSILQMKKLRLIYVNNPNFNGSYFHRFSWLKDDEIGELPCDWNWLVGWYKEDGVPRPFIIQRVVPGLKIIVNVNSTVNGKLVYKK